MAPNAETTGNLLSAHDVRLTEHERRIKAVETAVMDIRDELLGRPSWAVCILLTLLTSSTVGLLVAFINLQAGRTP